MLCFVFVFFKSVMIVLIYTGADEVAGDRAPQWAAFGTNVLFVDFCVYILNSYEEGYLFEM